MQDIRNDLVGYWGVVVQKSCGKECLLRKSDQNHRQQATHTKVAVGKRTGLHMLVAWADSMLLVRKTGKGRSELTPHTHNARA